MTMLNEVGLDGTKPSPAEVRARREQQPLAFAQNAVVKGFLERSGADCCLDLRSPSPLA